MEWPLQFALHATCATSNARAATVTLPHSVVPTPVFMPVGTQGTLKGVTTEQLEELDCRLMLGNTYHLGLRPVCLMRAISLTSRDLSCSPPWVVSINLWDGLDPC